jgi:hypothetical protein
MTTPNLPFKDFLKGYYKTMNPNWANDPAMVEMLQKSDTILRPSLQRRLDAGGTEPRQHTLLTTA